MHTTVLRPRYLALWMYLSYTLAGVMFVIFPSENTPRDAVGFFSLVIWHLFLVSGSFVSLIGVMRKRPALEATGIPLLASALVGYVVILLASAGTPAGSRFGLAFLFLSSAIGLIGRMVELLRFSRIAVDLDKRGE